MPKPPLFLILTFALTFFVRGESLESSDGRVIEVNLTRKDETHVWFKLPGKSRESSYEISKLSKKSQKFIKTWTAPKSSKLEIDFSSGKRNQKNDYGDIDDRCYSLSPKIEIRNLDHKSASFAGKAHLFIFGSPLKYRGDICLLAKRTFELPSIKANQTHSLAVEKEILFSYDDSDDSSGYGVRYKGYLLIFVDKKGKERFRTSVPANSFGLPLAMFNKMPEPNVVGQRAYAKIYSENFEEREGSSTRIK